MTSRDGFIRIIGKIGIDKNQIQDYSIHNLKTIQMLLDLGKYTSAAESMIIDRIKMKLFEKI